MALILARPLVFPIFFLGCFSLNSASTEDNVFHFDIEGSSAVGGQEDSLVRRQQQSLTSGSWLPFPEVQ